MRRTLMVLLTAAMVFAAAGVAGAGGRARVTMLKAPHRVLAGQEFDLAFTMRAEFPGRQRNVEPVVTAVCGERRVAAAASSAAGGRYAVTLRLPDAGEWRIRVDSQYCETVMDPLSVRVVTPKPRAS